MSITTRKPLPLPELESEDSIEAQPVEEETSQNWLLRHLRLFLEDVDDVHLTNFIHKQDITVFRNFMMGPTTERRCLFVVIQRKTQISSSPTITQPSKLLKQIEPIKKPANKMHTPGKLMKPKNVVKKKGSTKSKKSTNRLNRIKPELETDDSTKGKPEDDLKKPPKIVHKEILNDMMNLEIRDVNQASIIAEILLKWYNVEKIPKENEFVYVAIRDRAKLDEKNEFDQYYSVGYLKNAERFKQLMEISKLILREKLTYERQVDMLFMSQNLSATNREKWQNPEEHFENFISDSLSYAFWWTRKQELPTDDIDVESIEALLRPRIKFFVMNPNQQNLTQLWLELSLYEIKFLTGPSSTDTVLSRLQRIHTIFSALQLLYSGLNKEWLQKTIFYSIELISRIFATNIKENARKILGIPLQDDEEKRDDGDETEIKPIFLDFLKLGSSIVDERSEEHACLEKIRQCMRIIDFIEEELEKIQKLFIDLNDPKRDMMLDRHCMDKSYVIVREIWNVFEESYFESSLETGNFESLKNVCLQLTTFHNNLKETIPMLDEYCA